MWLTFARGLKLLRERPDARLGLRRQPVPLQSLQPAEAQGFRGFPQ